MKASHRTGSVAAAIVSLALFSLSASAVAQSTDKDTKWEKHHPRREQVNDRLANQNKRIAAEVKEGDMTKGQARKLHREDRQIRQEERDMAHQNNGHLTKTEQNVLNQQENQVSKQIGK